MMRSMFSGVSGLRAHQMMMDVVGDNIANINTAGFKASRALFEDTLSQTIRGGNAAANGQGGQNPTQVGLGVRVSGVSMTMTQGAIQNTGVPTDVAIQGEGFFVVKEGSEQLFTRAGAFHFDDSGNLVDPTGAIVQGWMADSAGQITSTRATADIKLPATQSIAPAPTTAVTIGGNLSANTPVSTGTGTATTPDPGIIDIPGTVHDALGGIHQVDYRFTHTSTGWTVEASDVTDPANPVSLGAAQPLKFTSTGNFDTTTPPISFTLPAATGATGGSTATFTVDFGEPGESLTQYADASSAQQYTQDGTSSGSLREFAIADDGTVTGVFSNGATKTIAQLALATFSDPAGLVKAGNAHYRMAGSAGTMSVGVAGSSGRGSLAAGALEMSNVDLSQEFTNMIIAQRGFEANSRIITSSDELLQDLVNLKH